MNSREPLYILFPRCKSCGKVLNNNVNYGKRLLESKKKLFTENDSENKFLTIDTFDYKNKTNESKILDEMGFFRYCCRNTLLTSSKNKTIIKYD